MVSVRHVSKVFFYIKCFCLAGGVPYLGIC